MCVCLWDEGLGRSAMLTFIVFVLSLMTEKLNGPWSKWMRSKHQHGSLKSILMLYGFLKDTLNEISFMVKSK